MKSFVSVLLLATTLLTSVAAFSPATSRPVLTPGRLIHGRTSVASFVLRAEEKQEAEATSPKVDADGTYYDDEVCMGLTRMFGTLKFV